MLMALVLRRILNKYLTEDEKKVFNQKFLIKILATFASILILLYLTYINIALACLVFSLISIALVIVYQYLGSKIDGLNPVQLLLSVYLVTLGHVAELLGIVISQLNSITLTE